MLKNHVFGSLNLNNSEIFRLSFEDLYEKNEPNLGSSGGGVHGKVCWLIAYKLSEYTDINTLSESYEALRAVLAY